ncbi:MAG: sensor histidine kinase [Acidimicrobiales bacterium]
MAIRNRILAVVLALVFLALAILDVVSYSVVRNSLISGADAQLQGASGRFFHSLLAGSPGFFCGGLPDRSFGALYVARGNSTLITEACATARVRAPSLPPAVAAEVRSPSSDSGLFVTVGRFRVMGEPRTLPNGSSVLLVVGEPLAPVHETLASVLILEIIVTGSILIAAGVTAFFLVQLGLRPLEKMAGTAGEIAAGDLSRRVEESDERTEVGRLGSALNVMLSRIEQAFLDKEASESRLRRFVADASHELRTPLTSIRGYAELFANSDVSPSGDLSAGLRRIESESARMSGLVEDLLLLARLDQGRTLDEVPVDLAALVEDAARDARVVAPERTISVSTMGDLVVKGDEARLRQVMANLVSNAVAHTPAGSPVELRAARAGDRVRLDVIDHGPGVPPGERTKVFDRFWRADESRQRSKGGSGLGLSLVSTVVAAHKGGVFVDATPGGGATFVVDLPAASTVLPEPDRTAERSAKELPWVRATRQE